MESGNVRERLEMIRGRMDAAARRSGRSPEDIRLVAVSKTVEPDRIRDAIQAGQLLFGENRVQEAKRKIEAIREAVQWHLVGHLQRNKVREAVRLFEMVHSVDSVALLEDLNRHAAQQQKTIEVLVQVNLDRETTKHGVGEESIPKIFTAVGILSSIQVKGLMILPRYEPDPEKSRPKFRRLSELAEEIRQKRYPNVEMRELSMGMTEDFEVAIEEGATLVRIGRAIFGERPNSPVKENR